MIRTPWAEKNAKDAEAQAGTVKRKSKPGPRKPLLVPPASQDGAKPRNQWSRPWARPRCPLGGSAAARTKPCGTQFVSVNQPTMAPEEFTPATRVPAPQ